MQLPDSPSPTGTFGRALLSLPPSPALPPTPAPTVFSDDQEGILRTQTFVLQESNEPISIRPPDEESWIDCILPAEHLEPGTPSAQVISSLPCIHLVRHTCAAPCLVGVAVSRVRPLCRIGIPLRYVLGSGVPANGWQLSEDEARIHGVEEAERRFHAAISDSAAEGAISGCPKGLLRLYRGHADHKDLVRMEWAELIKDIEDAPDGVADRFAVLCRHLGLRRLECEDSVSMESVEALLQRKPNEWVEQLHRAKKIFCAPSLSDQDSEWDGHVRSMLREVVEIAGGPENSGQREIGGERSAMENLAALGIAFGVDTRPGPVSINGSDAKHTRGFVLQELKPETAEDEVNFRKLMHIIGFPIDEHPGLPVGLLSSLSIKTITECVRPSVLAESPESVLTLFLCQHAKERGFQDPRLRRWMNTQEGRDGYSQIITTLKQTECPDLMAPCIAAGLYYMQVLENADTAKTLTHGSHLDHFFRHLEGRQPPSQAMWEHVDCSFLRGAAGYDLSPLSDTALSLLEKVVDWSYPSSSSMLDGYWKTRIRMALSHRDACKEMAKTVPFVSEELEAMKAYLATEDSGMGGRRANDLYSEEEDEAVY